MLVLLSTADTEILATAHAVRDLPEGFGAVRCANPYGVEDVDAFLDDLLDGARVVVARLLGGRRAWPEGVAALRARCARDGVALLLLGGEAEPDAELAELSSAPAATLAQAFEYLRHGGVENTANLLRFLADTLMREGHGFEPPRARCPTSGSTCRGAATSRSTTRWRATIRRVRPSASSSTARTA